MRKEVSFSAKMFLILVFSVSFTAASSIDISDLSADEYTPGETITFQVILLEDGEPIDAEVQISASDALEKKTVTQTATSNTETSIDTTKEFPSGLWTITATYEDADVERTFLIGGNSEVEFSIEADTLTIRNTGNVRYTKTIQIKIGGKTKSYAQNIPINGEKKLKLISPKGTYDIEITDGKNTIKRESVQLFGTGNVIGAIDEGLVGYTGLAGASDPTSIDEQNFSFKKLPVALVFVGAIVGLAVLLLISKKLTKKE
jgi:hypothetical protein